MITGGSRIGSCPQPLREAIHSSFVVPHVWLDSHETPSMTATSSPIVFTRAKARAIGIPLSDLLGPSFTRLFHDTYVGSGQMITMRLRAKTIMTRLPQATHVSHHTAVRLWGGVAPAHPKSTSAWHRERLAAAGRGSQRIWELRRRRRRFAMAYQSPRLCKLSSNWPALA